MKEIHKPLELLGPVPTDPQLSDEPHPLDLDDRLIPDGQLFGDQVGAPAERERDKQAAGDRQSGGGAELDRRDRAGRGGISANGDR